MLYTAFIGDKLLRAECAASPQTLVGMQQLQRTGVEAGMAGQNVWAVFTAVAVVLPLLHAPMATASTPVAVEMTCPYDGTKFRTTVLASWSTWGSDLDHRPTGGLWPLAECPTNGFVFLQDKYTEEELERLRPLVLSDEYQALKTEVTYYRAYWLRQRTGASRELTSLTLLQATWQVAHNQEKYARYVGELLDRLPSDIRAETEQNKVLRLRMLYGELLRRTGRFDEAKDYFQDLLSDLKPDSNESIITKLQITLSDKRDAKPRSVRSALGKDKEDHERWWRRVAPLTSSDIFKARIKHEDPYMYGGNLVWSLSGRQLHWYSPERLLTLDLDAPETKPEAISLPNVAGLLPLPGGEKLIVATRRGSLEQLDLRSRQSSIIATIPPLVEPINVVMAQNGSDVVIGANGTLVAFDTKANQIRNLPLPDFVQNRSGKSSVRRISSAAPIVIIEHRGHLIGWDYRKGQTAFDWVTNPALTVVMPNTDAAFSGDGSRLYVISETVNHFELEIAALNGRSGEVLARQNTRGLNPKISVSKDLQFIAVADGESLTILDNNLLFVVAAITHPEGFNAMAFSPDGRYLAVVFGFSRLVAVYAIEP